MWGGTPKSPEIIKNSFIYLYMYYDIYIIIHI